MLFSVEIVLYTNTIRFILGKFHTLTSRIFDNILSGNQEAEFPFDVNGTEIRIIKHFRTAAFILGRSGTGKTTCLLYKLLSRYLASAENAGVENRLRQVFHYIWVI